MRLFIARTLADALAPPLARWAASRERTILRLGQPLPESLVGFAKSLGISDPDELRFQEVDRIPLPVPDLLMDLGRMLGLPVFRPGGMAIGRAVVCTTADEALLRHEIVHLAQYQRLGGLRRFMRQYLLECLVHGYLEAPLEREARERSSR